MIVRLIFLLTALATVSLAQTSTAKPASPPPPPVVKPTPADKSELSDVELEQKILESITKPIAWKQHSPPAFEIAFEMPRDPIRQTETFFDEAIGNVKLEMHLSLGEGSTFVVGHFRMPYSVTDRALIREMFEEVAKEINSDATLQVKYSGDYDFNGHPGVELNSPGVPSGFLAPLIRGFVIGRSVYLLWVMPHHSPPDDEPLEKAQLGEYQKDVERFLASIAMKKVTAPAAGGSAIVKATVPPVFASSFAGGTFRSEYFKFSFKAPKGWLEVSQADVEGIRQVGRDYIAATSDLVTPTPRARQNLTTLVSKPLGNEGIAMIAMNVGPKSASGLDARKLAEITEGVVGKLPTYEIRKRPTATTLAGMKAYTMETSIRMTEAMQHQVLFFLQRRDHLLAVVVTYHDEADGKAAVAALQGINFEAL